MLYANTEGYQFAYTSSLIRTFFYSLLYSTVALNAGNEGPDKTQHETRALITHESNVKTLFLWVMRPLILLLQHKFYFLAYLLMLLVVLVMSQFNARYSEIKNIW